MMPSSSHEESEHLSYFEGSVYEAVAAAAKRYPKQEALDFLGSTISYSSLMENIHRCAASLTALGIQPGSTVTIALPNCPQAVYLFYAANLIGCTAAMLHPLSAPGEVHHFLEMTGSTAAITLEEFYPKFSGNSQLHCLILTAIADALPLYKKAVCRLAGGACKPKGPSGDALHWQSFLAAGEGAEPQRASVDSHTPAAILCSGGTSGAPKGVILTNRNLNALSRQIAVVNPKFRLGDKMLCALPMFHGFGLGVCIHAMLQNGGRCVLLPRFTPKSCVRALTRRRCAYIAGVPTLFQALLDQPGFRDLSFLKGVFCGGDTLLPELKSRFDRFLRSHKATVSIREGYGATETVAACCLNPEHENRPGSVGLPLPDTHVKIVAPGTDRALPPGQEGEILVSGPTVMQGYLDRRSETAQALRTHPDGRTWVYTGDLGLLDEDGFLYFRSRAKRMIVSSGYNVYPVCLEAVLDAHPLVKASCVIGLPDAYRGQLVTAFIEPEAGISPDEQTRQLLLEHCRKHVAKYALPRKIEFLSALPRTPLGKIDYRALEKAQKPGNWG